MLKCVETGLSMQISKAMGWGDAGYFSPVSSLQYTFTTSALLKDSMLKSVGKHSLSFFWRTGLPLESLTYKKNCKYSVKKIRSQTQMFKIFFKYYLILFNYWNLLFIFNWVCLQNTPSDLTAQFYGFISCQVSNF